MSATPLPPDGKWVGPRAVDYTAELTDDPGQNARIFRHAIKGELNAVSLLACACLRGEGPDRLPDDVRELLEKLVPLCKRMAMMVDHVRGLPRECVAS